MKIEKGTFIHQSVKIGKKVSINRGTNIFKNAIIGENVRIGCNVIIYENTKIGENVVIGDNAIIGKMPTVAKISAITKDNKLPPATIEEGSKIGSFVVIYRGCFISKDVFIADFASIREDVRVGEATIIGRGVTVENKVTIGKMCKIQAEAYITAISEIGDYCFIAPEVTFTNDNFLGRTKERFKYHKGVVMKRGARIGANATILPGIIIDEEGVVAAGSVVTRNVPTKTIVMGSPAKFFKKVPPEQFVDNQ